MRNRETSTPTASPRPESDPWSAATATATRHVGIERLVQPSPAGPPHRQLLPARADTVLPRRTSIGRHDGQGRPPANPRRAGSSRPRSLASLPCSPTRNSAVPFPCRRVSRRPALSCSGRGDPVACLERARKMCRALLQRLAAVRGRLSLCADQAAAAKWWLSMPMASVSAEGPMPKALSTRRTSPLMPGCRHQGRACPLRRARMTSNPLIVA